MTTKTKSIYFELISPDKILISQEVERIVAVTEAGEIGILPGHADLVTKLSSGPLKFWASDGSKDLVAVLGGVLEVKANKVSIVSDFAMLGADIDEAEAKQEADKAQAEIQLQSKSHSSEESREMTLAELKLKQELLKLQTVQLRKDF